MKANEIIRVLNQFKCSNYEKILIDGEWGIGKTKYVDDFIAEYPNTCYISLFGKKDIESIIQEIYYILIQDDFKGKFKKYLRKSTEILKNVNLSYSGFSLTVPLLGNIYSQMFKELNQKDSFIIIFDDLERKHENLGIKEFFGLIDSLSKIKGIKTVIVASTKNLGNSSKSFSEYREKAIDRTYVVEKYSDNAPCEILGINEWNALENIVSFLTFKNLRTFQKAKQFIIEVMDVLEEKTFTDKFTKEDVYRMCFATVVYNIEHNSQMILVGEEFRVRGSAENESVIVEYICGYILKSSLDNIMSKSILFHIKRWYETGEYNTANILNEISFINNFNYSTINHLSSEEEIIDVIQESKKFFGKLTGEETIGNVIQAVNNGMTWSGIFSVDFDIDKEEILRKIQPNIAKHVDIDKNLFENDISLSQYTLQKQEVKNVIQSINDAIVCEYYNKLADKIVDCLTREMFSHYYIKNLMESIIAINNEEIRENLKKKIETNRFFFPLPKGKVTQEHWDWCILNKMLILNIDKHWGIDGYYDNYVTFVKNEASNHQDRMLQHRIRLLFDGDY